MARGDNSAADSGFLVGEHILRALLLEMADDALGPSMCLPEEVAERVLGFLGPNAENFAPPVSPPPKVPARFLGAQMLAHDYGPNGLALLPSSDDEPGPMGSYKLYPCPLRCGRLATMGEDMERHITFCVGGPESVHPDAVYCPARNAYIYGYETHTTTGRAQTTVGGASSGQQDVTPGGATCPLCRRWGGF